MAIIAFLSLLIPFALSATYGYMREPCQCYDVRLQPGYPIVTGGYGYAPPQICYRYLIHKTDYQCIGNLDFYTLSVYVTVYSTCYSLCI